MRAILLLVAIGAAAQGQTQPGERTIRSEVEVGAVEFSSDGNSLAGLCRDNKIRHWDGRSGELKRTVALEKAAGAPAFASTGTVATTGGDGGIAGLEVGFEFELLGFLSGGFGICGGH